MEEKTVLKVGSIQWLPFITYAEFALRKTDMILLYKRFDMACCS